jgi:hypothetical protein
VIPADHPMVMALRRDVNPEALQPDGLLGTAMFHDSDVVLDYTDGTPGVRLSCADPDDGTCMALPTCDSARTSADPPAACCFGLPEDLLISLIDKRRLRLLRRPLTQHRRRAQQRRHRPRPPTTVRHHLFQPRRTAPADPVSPLGRGARAGGPRTAYGCLP